MKRRRALLLAVAALLCVSALFAITVLLVGRFGSTQGRVLGSTALLAASGLVALPAVVLLDRERARWLAAAGSASTGLAALLALVAIWNPSSPDTLGRTVGSAVVVALALSQLCALTARRGSADTAFVKRLFVASSATATFAAALAITFLWSNPHGSIAPRVLGALVVLDLLLVALQPILMRARPSVAAYRFEIALVSGDRVTVTVEGGDLPAAAARAIRSVERERGEVAQLTVKPADALAPVASPTDDNPRCSGEPAHRDRSRAAGADVSGR